VEVDPHRTCRQRRRIQHIDLLIPYRGSLESEIVRLPLAPHSLPLLPKPKGAGELADGEDALPVKLQDLLLPHPAQQAKIVILLGLYPAAVPELAGWAVTVEHQLQRNFARSEILDLS